jgi:hypothetical protein
LSTPPPRPIEVDVIDNWVDYATLGIAAVALVATVVAAVLIYRQIQQGTDSVRVSRETVELARQELAMANERNIVDWMITWPQKAAFTIKNLGPDAAHDVLVKLTIKGTSRTAAKDALNAGDIMVVLVPHLAKIWGKGSWDFKGPAGMRSNLVAYGVRITWTTPLGRQRVYEDDSVIQVYVKPPLDGL